MSSKDSRIEDLLDRLVLEAKAIALLYGTDAELRRKLEGRLTASHDEGVRRFVNALQKEAQRETGRLLAIAAGELFMASILVVAGTIVLVPNVAGVNTLSGLVQYFADRVSGNLTGSPLSPYLSFAEFAVGVALVLSAFFALREAAANLKQAGLAVKSGEA